MRGRAPKRRDAVRRRAVRRRTAGRPTRRSPFGDRSVRSDKRRAGLDEWVYCRMLEGAPVRLGAWVAACPVVPRAVPALQQRSVVLPDQGALRVHGRADMRPLQIAPRRATGTDGVPSTSDGGSPRSRSKVRAPAHGPAGMYLALTSGDGEVAESQRTVPRCTLAIVGVVLYALAAPMFWANAAHAKTSRSAPRATLVSKEPGSDSYDGEGDDHGDGGPDPHHGDSAAAPAGNSGTGVSAQSNNAAAPSNTGAANSNSGVAACPVTPSNTGAQANSNTGASVASNANANSNTGASVASNANANSNTGASVASNANANSNTGASVASNANANSNTGASVAS